MAARDSEQYSAALDDLLRVIARQMVREHFANRMRSVSAASAIDAAVAQPSVSHVDTGDAAGLAHVKART